MICPPCSQLFLKIFLIGCFLSQYGCAPTLSLKNELSIDNTQPLGKQIQFENIVNKPLTLGEEVETDARTIKTVLFPHGVEVILKPNTRIKISSVILFIGDVIVRKTGKFFEKMRSYFEVTTKPVIASMESTQFQVSVDRQGNVSVLVLEGVVKLTPTTPNWPLKLLKSSQKAVIREHHSPRIVPATPSELNETKQFIEQVDQAVHAAEVTNAALGAVVLGIGGLIIKGALGDKEGDGDVVDQSSRHDGQDSELGSCIIRDGYVTREACGSSPK